MAALTGVLLVVTGLVWAQRVQSPSATGDPVADGRSATPPAAAAPAAAVVRSVPGAPRRLRIPSLGVDARVLAVRAPGGTLVPPGDPTELGWWADGARPGARRGSVLVSGHTVHTGGGALDDLERVRPGEAITVLTARGRTAYVVRRVAVYRKGTLARRAPTLFAPGGPARLVVVTCEDWDGRRFLSNVVVVATPRD